MEGQKSDFHAAGAGRDYQCDPGAKRRLVPFCNRPSAENDACR